MPDPDLGRRVRTGAFDTNFHDRGQGGSVLLVHGSGPGATAWTNWQATLPLLAEDFRVLAPDLLGFGHTEFPAGHPTGTEVWARQVLDLLDTQGIGTADVIGHSYGGAVALHLAIHHPERVRRLVLSGSVGTPFPVTPELAAVWGYSPSAANMRRLLELFAYDSTRVSDDLVALRHQASIRDDRHQRYAALFAPPHQRWIDAATFPEAVLRAVPHPTLIVHGREDRVVPVAVAHTLSRWIGRSDLHILGRCGHSAPIEHGARFSRQVRDFLLEPA